MSGIGKSWVLAGWLAGTVLFGGPALGAGDKPQGGDSKAAALAAFDTIQTVLQHPRCQNCHIPGNAPLQLDAGLVHTQNVQRGPAGKGAPGLPCSPCHGVTNPPASYGPNTPPGAPNWSLPSPEHKM